MRLKEKPESRVYTKFLIPCRVRSCDYVLPVQACCTCQMWVKSWVGANLIKRALDNNLSLSKSAFCFLSNLHMCIWVPNYSDMLPFRKIFRLSLYSKQKERRVKQTNNCDIELLTEVEMKKGPTVHCCVVMCSVKKFIMSRSTLIPYTN